MYSYECIPYTRTIYQKKKEQKLEAQIISF